MNDRITRREALGLGAGFLSVLAWGCAAREDDGASAVGAGMSEAEGSPFPSALTPEDGYEAWLRYRPLSPARQEALGALVAGGIGVDPTATPVLAAARDELLRGLSAMVGREVRASSPAEARILLGVGSSPAIRAHVREAEIDAAGDEGYVLRSATRSGAPRLVIASRGDRGVLYGAFHLLRHLQADGDPATLNVTERPRLPLRLINHWDNYDRHAERGYAGLSIFDFAALPAVSDRYHDYARLLASVGLNGCVINNVNANARFLTDEFLDRVAPLARVFATYGIRLYLSANFAAPMTLGGLATASPFDPAVQAFWSERARAIHARVPSFGGLLVKANSEGQPGPQDFGASHADGANLLARALARHGDGIVMWRTFVWHEDGDRARVAYDAFQPLDGAFDANVVLQIKNGPLDFQVREPVHPLFGRMPHTNAMLELQLTQEYTGHATHLCYLVPQWKGVMDFDTHAKGPGSRVSDVVDGSLFGHRHAGVAGVRNVGTDRNWSNHPLAMANFHGFGRLAWDPELAPAAIAEEWTRATFGNDPAVVETVRELLLGSWETYELYTSPLGSGFFCEGGPHYDPHPPDKRYYHRAAEDGVGFARHDREGGSGYTALYHEPLAREYASLEVCAKKHTALLLAMHHVPYDFVLPSGVTVIQHIYDSHFDGAARVHTMRARWAALARAIDPARHAVVLAKFDAQIAHAEVWRDSIVGYFFHLSRVLDARRAWLAVRRIAMPARVVVGEATRVVAQVSNASDEAIEVEVSVGGRGWAGGGKAFVPARASQDVAIAATPSSREEPPTFTVTGARASGGTLPVLGPEFAQIVTARGDLRPWSWS